jgi:hypothetical protein
MISNNWHKVKQLLQNAQPHMLQRLAQQHKLWTNLAWFYQAASDIANLTSADQNSWLTQLLLHRPTAQQPRLSHNVPVIWSCKKLLDNATYASCDLALLEPQLQQALAYQHNLSTQQLLELQQHVVQQQHKPAQYCTRVPQLRDLRYANQITRQILLQLGYGSIATRHSLAISDLQNWDVVAEPLVPQLLQQSQSLIQY